MNWFTEWPTKVGTYWCYARIGKYDSWNKQHDYKLTLAECISTGHGRSLSYIAHGNFFYRSEVEGTVYWADFEAPELPNV